MLGAHKLSPTPHWAEPQGQASAPENRAACVLNSNITRLFARCKRTVETHLARWRATQLAHRFKFAQNLGAPCRPESSVS